MFLNSYYISLLNCIGHFGFSYTSFQISAVYSKIAILRSWQRFHYECTEATAEGAMEWMWAIHLKVFYEGSQGKVWSDSLNCFPDFWIEPPSWGVCGGYCWWGVFLLLNLLYILYMWILCCPNLLILQANFLKSFWVLLEEGASVSGIYVQIGSQKSYNYYLRWCCINGPLDSWQNILIFLLQLGELNCV